MSRSSARGRGWVPLAGIAGLVVCLDQATKAVVRAALALDEQQTGFGPFTLHHVRNSGLLGGHLQGSAVPLGIATALLLLAFVVFIVRRRPALPELTGFALVLGGGLGNLVDRLRLGYVTDFVDRGNGRAFNLADVSITLGLLVLAGTFLLSRGRTRVDVGVQTD